MQTVKTTTKKGKELLDRAIRYEGYSLWDVYGRYSRQKEEAWNECFKKFKEEGGRDFRICGHCISNFSVSWRTEAGWRLETYKSSYLITETEEE